MVISQYGNFDMLLWSRYRGKSAWRRMTGQSSKVDLVSMASPVDLPDVFENAPPVPIKDENSNMSNEFIDVTITMGAPPPSPVTQNGSVRPPPPSPTQNGVCHMAVQANDDDFGHDNPGFSVV